MSTLLRDDPTSGRKGGTPRQQREWHADRLEMVADQIERGEVKIKGVSKKVVVERLRTRSKRYRELAARGGRTRAGDAWRGKNIHGKRDKE